MANFNAPKALAALVLFVSLFGNLGCSVTASRNVKSEGIYATNSVEAGLGSTVCRSTLQVGGATGTYIDLVGDDELFCNGVRMNKVSSVANQIRYEAAVSFNPGSTYRIEFKRKGESMEALIQLPTAIMGFQVDGGINQTIGRPFSVSWQKSANPQERMQATLMLGTQRQSNLHTASLADGGPETGRINFRGEDSIVRTHSGGSPQQEPGPYSGTLTLRRTLRGSLSGAWSGQALGSQEVQTAISFQ